MAFFFNLKKRIKARKSPSSRFIYALIVKARFLSFPAPKFIYTPLLFLHLFLRSFLSQIILFFYWKPLFIQYLEQKPKKLCLMKTMPFIIGNPSIQIGKCCRINGDIVISARSNQATQPKLIIKDNVFIGYKTQFYIGSEIIIGDNCMISEDCTLRGHPGHPINPEARILGLPEEDSTVGPIILENNVWLGQGVKINPGVRIGENSVIGTGSIVTQDIPANTVAVGIPAKVIKSVFS